jgi:hypothetical protein
VCAFGVEIRNENRGGGKTEVARSKRGRAGGVVHTNKREDFPLKSTHTSSNKLAHNGKGKRGNTICPGPSSLSLPLYPNAS